MRKYTKPQDFLFEKFESNEIIEYRGMPYYISYYDMGEGKGIIKLHPTVYSPGTVEKAITIAVDVLVGSDSIRAGKKE